MGRGALVFKGDSKRKSQKRPHSVKKNTASSSHVTIRHTPPQEEAAVTVEASKEESPSLPAPPQLIPGPGRIVVSGTVVTIVPPSASFPADLQAGDAVLIQDELRVVTIKVSNHCLNLSSALTKNTSSGGGRGGMDYSYICKPKAPTKKEAPDGDPASELLLLPPTSIYRERTEHGNYRIKSGPAAGDRSAALAWRSKKTSDKYC